MKTIEELRKELLGKCLNDFIVINVYEMIEGINHKTYIDVEKRLILPVKEGTGNTKVFVELEHKKTKSKRIDPFDEVYDKLLECS